MVVAFEICSNANSGPSRPGTVISALLLIDDAPLFLLQAEMEQVVLRDAAI